MISKQIKRRILCVDGNEDICSLLVTRLERDGYEIVSASTIGEALVIANTKSFNLFILGELLPDGTGIDLCEKLRAIYLDTPILYFSALVQKSDRDKAMTSGAHAFVPKPDLREELGYTIELLLEHKELNLNSC